MTNSREVMLSPTLTICEGEKWEFYVHRSAILGYIIGPEGVLMEQDKVSTVTNWPVSTSIKGLQ